MMMPRQRKGGQRGFAAMDPDERRAIASEGGRSQGAWNNPGNFANDPMKAKRAGQQGGRARGKQSGRGGSR